MNRNILRLYSRIKYSLGQLAFSNRALSSANSAAPGEEMDELKKNPYYEKYAKRIADARNESKDEFEKKINEWQNSKKVKKVEPKEKSFVQQTAKPDLKSQPNISHLKTKKLEDIIKLELIVDKSEEDISEIWKKYHKKENNLSAIIEKEKYEMIQERALKHNTFLFPLPRDQGYEFIVCQFNNNECHFTTLLNYQTYKENAPECLTLIHFSELADSKGIVLMKGEYHSDVINAIEAQCLVNQLQLFYASDDPAKTKLMETFTQSPDSFKHNDLVVELQKSLFNI